MKIIELLPQDYSFHFFLYPLKTSEKISNAFNKLLFYFPPLRNHITFTTHNNLTRLWPLNGPTEAATGGVLNFANFFY